MTTKTKDDLELAARVLANRLGRKVRVAWTTEAPRQPLLEVRSKSIWRRLKGPLPKGELYFWAEAFARGLAWGRIQSARLTAREVEDLLRRELEGGPA